MKKLLILFLLVSQAAFGQILTGTIKYDLKYNMNPKEKEQMEKFGVALPSEMEMSSDGTNAKMKMSSSAGVMMEMLHVKDNSYFLDVKNKKAYKMPENMGGGKSGGSAAKVTKTEEFETIAGHKSRKYIVETGRGKQEIWASPDYKMSPTMLANMTRRGPGDTSFMKEIEGVPLKITSNEQGNSFEMVAKSITDTKPSSADMSLPSDFTVEPFNPAVLGMMMGGGGPPRH